MSFIRTVQLGLRSLLRKNEAERDLDDELHHFIEMSARQNVKDGMTPENALRAARM